MSTNETNEACLIVKLSSGEELIAKIKADEFNYYLTEATQIVQYPDQSTGSMRVGLIPFMPYAEEEIVVSRVGVVTAFPKESMVMSYRQFISGIELPNTDIVLAK